MDLGFIIIMCVSVLNSGFRCECFNPMSYSACPVSRLLNTVFNLLELLLFQTDQTQLL